jgi:hypothetical protein
MQSGARRYLERRAKSLAITDSRDMAGRLLYTPAGENDNDRIHYYRTHRRMVDRQALEWRRLRRVCDVLLGLVGGIVGAAIFAMVGLHAHNAIGAIVIATAGSIGLVTLTRILNDEL